MTLEFSFDNGHAKRNDRLTAYSANEVATDLLKNALFWRVFGVLPARVHPVLGVSDVVFYSAAGLVRWHDSHRRGADDGLHVHT